MVAELVALVAATVVAVAEALHAVRVGRLARLAFGPGRRPSPWARLAPVLRVAAFAATAWGLCVLLLDPPKVHQAEEVPDKQKSHLLLVLDVSPSMRLKDAGPDRDQTRMERAAVVLESLIQRAPMDRYLVSVVACYNGAKPVVVDTKDLEVVRNLLDLPMQYAFSSGKTDLFSGLAEAARLAAPWQPRSTLLVVLADGDTVPATGMPKLPTSVSDVLIVGVGDPRTGSFIDGRQSRQDASTLRQIAIRLGGTYHDANEKHLGTNLLNRLTVSGRKAKSAGLSRREYALLACGLGSSTLALLPLLLHYAGTTWRPGVPGPPSSRHVAGARARGIGGARFRPPSE